MYTLIQLDIWTAAFCVFLFMSVRFPFAYRHLKMSGKMRYAHIILVLLGVIVPIPGPLIVQYTGGYIITTNPNLISAGRGDTYFYLLVLPACMLVAIQVITMTLIFWTIFKVCYIIR